MATTIPDGYHSVNPYLIVPDGEKMVSFLQEVFGAKLRERFNRPDGTIKHAELEIGDCRIMLAQANEQFAPRPQTLYVYLLDVDAAYARGLNSGAKSLMEVSQQNYGDRNGGFEDPAGNWWWVATRVEDVSVEEIERREQASQKLAS
jgi:PhnB protein